MLSADWFCVTELGERVWQITEPGHVAMWLVEGSQRTALIDTGCGFVPLRPTVEALTDKPVVVVQTHHHLDHIGGSPEFDEVLIHPLGVEGLATPLPTEVLAAYVDYALEMERAYAAYEPADAMFFHLLEEHMRLRPLPEPARSGGWSLAPVTATGTFEEGDVLDLGGRALRVLHTPGHSPDCVSLDLVGERILFGGDTVNTGPVYTQFPESDPAVLRASLARLADEGEQWDRVFCSHFMRTEVPVSYLARQVAALDALLAGTVALRPFTDCVGQSVLEAVFDGFSFLLPESFSPQEVLA